MPYCSLRPHPTFTLCCTSKQSWALNSYLFVSKLNGTNIKLYIGGLLQQGHEVCWYVFPQWWLDTGDCKTLQTKTWHWLCKTLQMMTWHCLCKHCKRIPDTDFAKHCKWRPDIVFAKCCKRIPDIDFAKHCKWRPDIVFAKHCKWRPDIVFAKHCKRGPEPMGPSRTSINCNSQKEKRNPRAYLMLWVRWSFHLWI